MENIYGDFVCKFPTEGQDDMVIHVESRKVFRLTPAGKCLFLEYYLGPLPDGCDGDNISSKYGLLEWLGYAAILDGDTWEY